MGLFSFVGKAIKGIGKVVGGVVKTGIKIGAFGVKSGLIPIPGGGLVGKVAGTLLGAKQPMNSLPMKIASAAGIGIPGMRGHSVGGFAGPMARAPAPILRMSPVLPGGAVATRAGPAPRPTTAVPPSHFAGGSPIKRRKAKKRKSSARRSTRTRGRKLKFGSPAWRKKYMRKRRRAA